MGLQRSKRFFFQLQIRWIFTCPDRRISLQFRPTIVRDLRDRKCDFLEAPFGTACTVRVPVPPKPSPAACILGSDRASLRFQQRGFLPTVDSHLKSVFHRRLTLQVELTELQVDRVAGRLRKQAESVWEYDTHKKPCILWGQILLVFYQNIWDNFWIFLIF